MVCSDLLCPNCISQLSKGTPVGVRFNTGRGANYLFTCAFTDDSKSFNFKWGNFGLLVTVLLIY